MINQNRTTITSITATSTSSGSQEQGPEPVITGRPRRFDDCYQKDVLEYLWLMRGILRLLSVRSAPDLRSLLLMLPLRILNCGQVEASVLQSTVYLDIALLDLLWLFSFEQGVADVKRDPYHMLEFTLNYADALHTNRPFEQLDPYNSAALSDAQFRQLWEDAQHIQRISFENTLAFILAHEVGHLVLGHEKMVKKPFSNSATHPADNPDWLLWRRRAELAADRFGALLSLDANYQPAQVIPWFDLVEVRRSYYEISVEYPTPGQRASTIWSAYAERFGGNGIDTSGLPKVDPLPPDRDMSKMDRARNLENIRRLRTFRRNFLVELDAQVGEILRQSQNTEDAAAFFLNQIQAYRHLLRGADRPMTIEEALALLDLPNCNYIKLIETLHGLFKSAFSAPEAVDLLTAHLDQEPLDIEKLRQLLGWARKGLPLFADALDLRYIMANTRFRWEPGLFQSILAQLPQLERSKLKLAPYRIGVPAHSPRFSIEERLEALQHWDGSYADGARLLPKNSLNHDDVLN